MNPKEVDIIVIGGGVVGLSAALAMAQRDYSVAVLDAGDLLHLPSNSRVYALNHTSQELLEQLGVWDKLDLQQVSPYRAMHIWDAISHEKLDFDARIIGQDRLGVMVDESTLKQALLGCLATTNVLLESQMSVIDLHEETHSVNIVCKDALWKAKWIIISDGGNSTTSRLLNVPTRSWPYNQSAITARIKIAKSHQNKAYQVFYPDGPLALLPLALENQCAVVWSSDQTARRMQLSEHEFNLELKQALCDIVGDCELISERRTHPLVMRHALQYVGKRWILMGDAAHTIHPLAGLGLNIGLSDLATWLTLLAQNNKKHWSSAILGRYQRQRKYMVWQMIICMETLKRVFSTSFPLLVFARGLGVRMCQNVSFLKHFFIEQASRS
jgi:2-polyprenylphenol 6-hydroxylase